MSDTLSPPLGGKFDFHLDLPYGQEAEAYVKRLFSGMLDPAASEITVEVKRDDRALETGNIYLEFSQQAKGVGPWKRSGLAITEASHFAVVVGNAVYAAPTAAWKWVGNEYGFTRKTGGDNPTRGRCVPLANLPKRLAQAPYDNS